MELKANEGCCEEAGPGSRDHYIPCNKPATKLVYHKKDRRTYQMCDMCSWHNVKNRGGKYMKHTFALRWEEYYTAMFGKRVVSPQIKEFVKQSFYAGGLGILTEMGRIASGEGEVTMSDAEELGRIQDEIIEGMADMILKRVQVKWEEEGEEGYGSKSH